MQNSTSLGCVFIQACNTWKPDTIEAIMQEQEYSDMKRTPRIRGRKLQQIRKELFTHEPLCRTCKAKGRVTIATEADHIIRLRDGGTNEPDNWQPLCKPCHDDKTVAENGGKRKQQIGADGWPTQ